LSKGGGIATLTGVGSFAKVKNVEKVEKAVVVHVKMECGADENAENKSHSQNSQSDHSAAEDAKTVVPVDDVNGGNGDGNGNAYVSIAGSALLGALNSKKRILSSPSAVKKEKSSPSSAVKNENKTPLSVSGNGSGKTIHEAICLDDSDVEEKEEEEEKEEPVSLSLILRLMRGGWWLRVYCSILVVSSFTNIRSALVSLNIYIPDLY